MVVVAARYLPVLADDGNRLYRDRQGDEAEDHRHLDAL